MLAHGGVIHMVKNEKTTESIDDSETLFDSLLDREYIPNGEASCTNVKPKIKLKVKPKSEVNDLDVPTIKNNKPPPPPQPPHGYLSGHGSRQWFCEDHLNEYKSLSFLEKLFTYNHLERYEYYRNQYRKKLSDWRKTYLK